MKPKKNPSKDPAKNSFLFFSIAFTFLFWMALYLIDFPFQRQQLKIAETKPKSTKLDTSEPEITSFKIETVNQQKVQEFKEDYRIDDDNNPEPEPEPEPIQKPTDDSGVEISVPNKPISDAQSITYIEPVDPIDIPLDFVEDIPVFPGCEKISKAQQKACFHQKMREFIQKNTRYPETAIANQQSGIVLVEFLIESSGNIKILRVQGPYPILENEAQRVIRKLPKMTPGRQHNKPVNVKFLMPINFNQINN